MHVGVIHRISDPEGSNAPNRRPLRRASLTALVFPSMPPLPTTGPASASGKDLRSMQLRAGRVRCRTVQPERVPRARGRRAPHQRGLSPLARSIGACWGPVREPLSQYLAALDLLTSHSACVPGCYLMGLGRCGTTLGARYLRIRRLGVRVLRARCTTKPPAQVPCVRRRAPGRLGCLPLPLRRLAAR